MGYRPKDVEGRPASPEDGNSRLGSTLSYCMRSRGGLFRKALGQHRFGDFSHNPHDWLLSENPEAPSTPACVPPRKQGAGTEVVLATPSMCCRPRIWPTHAVSAPTTDPFHCHLCVLCWYKSWPPGPRTQASTSDLQMGTLIPRWSRGLPRAPSAADQVPLQSFSGPQRKHVREHSRFHVPANTPKLQVVKGSISKRKSWGLL